MAKKKSVRKTPNRAGDWKKNRFEGLKVCFAGKPKQYGVDRSEFEEWAEDDGAEVVKTTTADTDLLIVLEKGATAGAKKKAQSLNQKGACIAIISEDDFTDRFEPKFDEVVDLIAAGAHGRNRLENLLARCRSAYVHRSKSIDLTGAKLRGIDLSGLMLRGVILDGSDLREANLETVETAVLKDVRFEKALGDHFRPSGMVRCKCKGAHFPNLFMGFSSYGHKETVVDCDFTNANLYHAYFNFVPIERTSFKKAVLTEAKLSNTELTEVDFTAADLTQADLRETKCKNNVVFTRAKLCQAQLQHAILTGADLRNADLSHANLSGTSFDNADVSGAKFNGAIVIGASFKGVDISKAKDLQLHPTTAVKLGRASTELNNVFNQADEIRVQADAQLTNGSVSVRLEKQYGRFSSGFKLHIDDNIIKDSKQQTGCKQGLTSIGQTWGHAQLQFDTIKVNSTKSPLKGKALRDLAASALAEAFGDDIPSEAQLKEQRKKTREAATGIKQELLAELRGGEKGVKKFNARKTEALVSQKRHRLRKEDFSGANLDGLCAPEFDFQNCNFENASLAGVVLNEADLRKSSLADADFHSAQLSMANLSSCDLTNADLRMADLSYATLSQAVLAKADLTGANLCGANLEGAQLTGASIKNVNWGGSTFDENTKFPARFKIPGDFYFTGTGHDPRIKVAKASGLDEISDFDGFMERLTSTVDQSRLNKSLKMLKADSFQLFSEVGDDQFVGVVKSQTDASLVYSCRLSANGDFACCTQNLNPCGGLRGALCKHLLVLIVGLTKGGKLDANSAATWAHESLSRKPDLDKDAMSEVLLRYKGAEAGEVDWRPMETIPEDYYTL